MNNAQRMMREMLIIAIGIVATIYLLNPTAGFIELIPDTLPIVGNLDEAAAVTLLLTILRYYGIDPTALLRRDDKDTPETVDMPGQDAPR